MVNEAKNRHGLAREKTMSVLGGENIDEISGFKRCLEDLERSTTHDFVVTFDTDGASCATNIAPAQLESFVRRTRSNKSLHCRWFNLWGWTLEHQTAIKTLGEEYNVSPRLIHLMCPSKSSQDYQPLVTTRSNIDSNHESAFEEINSLEKALPANGRNLQGSSPGQPWDRNKPATSISEVVDDLWHFCSVDWGRRYLCIGFNGLFNLSAMLNKDVPSKPNATRIWSALLICDDGTVVSTFEAPNSISQDLLTVLRRNQVNIFLHLSRLHTHWISQNVLMQVNIRPLRHSKGDTDTKPFDVLEASSLLFYYLFDDWFATYSLISGRDHPYRERLELLRQKMMTSAEVDDVEALHQIGRQLTVLKRVYESYETIVSRILQKQRYLLPEAAVVARRESSHEPNPFHAYQPGQRLEATIPLASSALGRFERLLDRICLYALAEIEECLAEKEALVLMVSDN